MSTIGALMKFGMLRALFVAAIFSGAVQWASASEHPVWWDDALTEGEQGHYEVLDFEAMHEALHCSDAIVMDVRPDYEYARGDRKSVV